MEDTNKEALLLIEKLETHCRMFASYAKAYHNGSGCVHINITALLTHYDKLVEALEDYEVLNDHFSEMMVEKSIDLETLFIKPKQEKKR